MLMSGKGPLFAFSPSQSETSIFIDGGVGTINGGSCGGLPCQAHVVCSVSPTLGLCRKWAAVFYVGVVPDVRISLRNMVFRA